MHHSTLGQGLETSTYPLEIIFSISLAISGLILFALLIGNMQVSIYGVTLATITINRNILLKTV